MPLTTKEEVKRWYEAADVFDRRLRTDWISIYDSLPHELEHYLIDAELRFKDAGYAEYQRKLLDSLLSPEEPIQLPEPTSGLKG